MITNKDETIRRFRANGIDIVEFTATLHDITEKGLKVEHYGDDPTQFWISRRRAVGRFDGTEAPMGEIGANWLGCRLVIQIPAYDASFHRQLRQA